MLASLFADAEFQEHKNSDHAQTSLLLLAAFLRCEGLHGEIGAMARWTREVRDEVSAPGWDERSAYRCLIATGYNPQVLLTALIATAPDPEGGFSQARERGATSSHDDAYLTSGHADDPGWKSKQVIVMAPSATFDAMVAEYVN